MEGLETRILAIEERLVDVRLVLSALEWQLKELVIWKNQAEIQLAELVKAEEIAEAVSRRIKKTNTLRLTFVQKLLAGVVSVIAITEFILQLTGKI